MKKVLLGYSDPKVYIIPNKYKVDTEKSIDITWLFEEE